MYILNIVSLQSIIDKCRICGTEGETIEHIISSFTVLAQNEYKKRHDIFAKIIHMNLAVKFNLLKDTQPHYIYKPESCLENDNYKLYFDRTVLTDIHIQHNRPDIIILNKQQKQGYLLDIAVPNSHSITQTYNTKINKYLEFSVAMRNLWSLEKISILPLTISATGIVPQSLFKNLKILDLGNTLVVEIQNSILYLYQELKMKDFTRVCRIEPQAVGAWLKQTSVKSNFQHVVYTIFFRRPQKKTLIFGVPSNFKYYSTELRTK
jgi:hypothetical protein